MTVKEMAALGGEARAKKLTSAQRQEIARQGGRNRWKNRVRPRKIP